MYVLIFIKSNRRFTVKNKWINRISFANFLLYLPKWFPTNTMKITSWNLEHSHRLIANNPDDTVKNRIVRVKSTIENINPDILCLQEGPKGEEEVKKFCQSVLGNRWVPILLNSGSDKDYQIDGTQWIWFLVKEEIAHKCRLQSPEIWQAFTDEKLWKVYMWGNEISTRHGHYRHPQVLIYDIDGSHELELIGVHLKSKINKKKILWLNGDLRGDYVNEALQARVKLATEASNIRKYIGAKFDQLEKPGILLMGDCNDGIGLDYFEQFYMYFDLVNNLQGEVLMAERFFNHALFDYSQHLRWTAKYSDPIMKISASKNPLLIDHILISQPLVRGALPLKVNAKAGKVEHEDFERYNAGSNSKTRTSDHRPVSILLDPNTEQ